MPTDGAFLSLVAATETVLLDGQSGSTVLPGSVVTLAGPHGVASLVLRGDDVRQSAVDRLVRGHVVLDCLSERFETAALPWLVVKGPAVSLRHYATPLWRSFSDVDVLVPPDRFGEALDELTRVGGVPLVESWRVLRELELAQVSVAMPAGVTVDLHWHLINNANSRTTFDLRTSTLLDRRERLPGTGWWVLDRESEFIHLAWHAVKEGGRRLIWACDLALIASQLDPAIVVKRSESFGMNLPVAVGVDWASALLTRFVSLRHMASALPRSVWRDVLLRRYTYALKRGRLQPGQRTALLRATRRSTLTSARALALYAVPRRGLAARAPRDESRWRSVYLEWVREIPGM
ncbi:nucleotidyltransferase family protein [Aquipuribacter nitratireducens]|uniref:Nucleotidyltransferase family protein n=1 Tax=Aquipuribacter nitratireducens TaxID=650104 RepID=A0ABW0GSN4_9MICO